MKDSIVKDNIVKDIEERENDNVEFPLRLDPLYSCELLSLEKRRVGLDAGRESISLVECLCHH